MTNNLMSQFNMEGKVRTKNGNPIGKLKRAFKSTKTMPAIEGNFLLLLYLLLFFFKESDVSQDFGENKSDVNYEKLYIRNNFCKAG